MGKRVAHITNFIESLNDWYRIQEARGILSLKSWIRSSELLFANDLDVETAPRQRVNRRMPSSIEPATDR
jgi:hypothetical protein